MFKLRFCYIIIISLIISTLVVTEHHSVQAQTANLPPDFTEQVIVEDLVSPVNIRFAPDGRLFILEQDGRILVVENDVLQPQPLLTLNVNTVSERGLLGITFDPDFNNNGYFYIFRTIFDDQIGQVRNRISRFTSNGNTADPNSEVIVLNLNPLGGLIHNSGEMHFGPDGMLYVAVGDDDQWPGNPNHLAQRLDTAFGKIIRLTPDGNIPADNPFYDTATGLGRATWALGLRSPFNFMFRPGTNCIYVNDVGEDSWEEINEACAGDNLGWNLTEGYHNNPNFVQPLFAYPHGFGPDINEGCAAVGGTFYTPAVDQFPQEYVGDYFFSDYCREWIQRYNPDNDTVTPFATGLYNAVIDLVVSPDGALYYLARGNFIGDGRVYRIQYALNEPPTIAQNPADVNVTEGDPAQFTCVASGEPPITYQWQRDGVDIPGATDPTYTIPQTVLADNGATFRCVATNLYGDTPSQYATLLVAPNEPPLVIITEPQNGSFYIGGDTITYIGQGIDPEDGPLPDAAYTWWIDFHHNEHTHPFLLPTTGVPTGTFTIPVDPHGGGAVWYRIYLRVTDSGGLTAQTYSEIFPQTVLVTLNTRPRGVPLDLNGATVDTPYTFDGIIGVTYLLDAPLRIRANGIRYGFDAWSDGSTDAANHALLIPNNDITYTADYRRSSNQGDDDDSSDSDNNGDNDNNSDSGDVVVISDPATGTNNSTALDTSLLAAENRTQGFDPIIVMNGRSSAGGFGVLGEQITWDITVANRGNTPGTNVVITDPLDAILSVDSADAGGARFTINGQTVTFTIPTLAPGQLVQLKVVTTIDRSPVGGLVSNTATLTSSQKVTRQATAGVRMVGVLPRTGEPKRPGWVIPLIILLPVLGVGLALMRGRYRLT